MKRFKRMRLFFKKNTRKDITGKLNYYHDYIGKKNYDIVDWANFNKEKRRYNRFNYFFLGNPIILFIWRVLKAIFRKKNVLFAYGTHLISGFMGAGKSLLMNYIIKNVDSSKYFFYSNQKEFKSENVYYIDNSQLFDNNRQEFSLPTVDAKKRHLYGVIYDEVNRDFNRRMNRTKTYNNRFMGLIEFIVSSRHQGVKRIYFIGQKMELQDTQLMILMRFNHFCKKCVLRYDYQAFKENDKKYIEKKPKKIKIRNYIKNDINDFIPLKHNKRMKVKIDRYIYDSYNTHELADFYSSLPPIINFKK